jgi:hypothetical protein
MTVRFTVRRLFLLTAGMAYALAIYLEVGKWRLYHRDEAPILVTPLPNAPSPPPNP